MAAASPVFASPSLLPSLTVSRHLPSSRSSSLLSGSFCPKKLFRLAALQIRHRKLVRLNSPRMFVCSLQKLADVIPISLSHQHVDALAKLPAAPGVYAIYDQQGELQFLGLSRRVSSSLQSHVRHLPELCASAKISVIDTQEKSALVDAWKQWMEEYVQLTGKAPPGNLTGVTTWTSRKPMHLKPDLQLMPSRHKELTISLEELIDRVVKENKVVAFIKGSRASPACRFSHRVLTILNEEGVNYETVNVLDEEHNAGVREALKSYSQWPTLPQVFVSGQFVGGSDIMDEMAQNGSLKSLFQKTR
eukprot:c24479_g1_i1 orf=296-1207(+)